MTDPAELERQLEARIGLVSVGKRTVNECIEALRHSLPGMEQAVQLFERAIQVSGARGWEDPDRGVSRRLFLRDPIDPSFVVAQPLLEHQTEEQLARSSFEIQIPISGMPAQAQPPKPAPPPQPAIDIPSRTANMRAGTLTVFEGAAKMALRFGKQGQSAGGEISSGDPFCFQRHRDRPFHVDPGARPPAPPPVSLLCAEDLDPSGHSVDDLARRIVAATTLAAAVPARVRTPVPIPFGPHGAWQRALPKIREALWEQRIPAAARFVVADGYIGAAIAHGTTREEALASWQEQVQTIEPLSPDRWNVRALPEPPPVERPPRIDLGDGTTLLHLGLFKVEIPPTPTDLAWPRRLEDTPAVLLPLPELPEVPPSFRAAGFARTMRLCGALGQISHVLCREDPEGMTLVGEAILDLIDPATLDAALDASDAPARERWKDVPPEQQAHNPWRAPERCVPYLFWDSARQAPMPPMLPPPTGDAQAGGLSPQALDGDSMKWLVVRWRRGPA